MGCCLANKISDKSEESDVHSVKTERNLSNGYKTADGGMTQQAVKISLIFISQYPLSNSIIHCMDPLFNLLQDRELTITKIKY